MIDFGGGPAAGDLDVQWIHGHRAGRDDRDPPIQVHAFDAHTFILRQSKAVHPEAPFMYLLFGYDRALLVDTGATADSRRFPLRATVEGVINGWLATHPRPRTGYGLVVAHTHGHADHVAADIQFADRPGTTVVPAEVDGMRSFFGFRSWPDEVVAFDLGGRQLEITGCPGHHEAAIALFDAWSGSLMTGDTIYPGRLFVSDMPAFEQSLDHLVDFAGSRRVAHILGGHIEMTRRPGRDYPLGALYQPDEPPLQMKPTRLVALRDAAVSVADRRGIHRFEDFVIVNRPGIRSGLPLVARSLWHRLSRWRPVDLEIPRTRS